MYSYVDGLGRQRSSEGQRGRVKNESKLLMQNTMIPIQYKSNI